ncbi:MAG: hypothetical protein H0X30_07675 [Anaerolineae bacterium]|nr:hypothetical protein [Anaerolineae bacterium]
MNSKRRIWIIGIAGFIILMLIVGYVIFRPKPLCGALPPIKISLTTVLDYNQTPEVTETFTPTPSS